MNTYENSKSSLTALLHQTAIVLAGSLVFLLLFRGAPSSFGLSLAVILGIAWVVWSEKTRLTTHRQRQSRAALALQPLVNTYPNHPARLDESIRSILASWGEMSDRDRLWLMQTGMIREVPDGIVLISEGRPIDALYIVLSGTFEVSASTLGDQKITTFSDGQVMGEMSFVKQGSTPSATVKALGKSYVWLLPRTALTEKINHDRDFAARFYQALARILADRLRTTTRASLTTQKKNRLPAKLHRPKQH
jgi:CRP/FNR family transcriptional regulator, cyclic AMP receptor protein